MFNHIPYFERNSTVLDNPKVNCYFEDLLDMDLADFELWVVDMRETILDSWDKHGTPPRSGSSKQEITDTFETLSSAQVSHFTETDELNTDGTTEDVIHNKSRIGSQIDQFFPTMMTARINFSLENTGFSIYDMFADKSFLPRMVRGCKRHFRRDSFYHYSHTMRKNCKEESIVPAQTGKEWIDIFHANRNSIFRDYDFWLCEEIINTDISSGYKQVSQSNQLYLTQDELDAYIAQSALTERNLVNIGHSSKAHIQGNRVYVIRLFKLRTERIFPHGFTAFRIGYTNVAVNFPPLTAKYLYERYTSHFCSEYGTEKPINIYDPSCGWGGRILGAMAVKDDRYVHYIGTDPNTDNILEDGKTRYEYVSEFFNENTSRGNAFFSHANTCDIFTCGSEEIHKEPRFKQYKGKLDLVFTSPPYFNREAYSEDAGQSYKNFPEYDSWREGFLRKTLETCVEYLREERYLLWNIADIKLGDTFLPLEKDSIDILKSLGMEYRGFLKMVMKSMPGANRLDETGTPKCKNFCKVDGVFYKYEPVFVFWKPKSS